MIISLFCVQKIVFAAEVYEHIFHKVCTPKKHLFLRKQILKNSDYNYWHLKHVTFKSTFPLKKVFNMIIHMAIYILFQKLICDFYL